jgi:hypothetical protein
MCHYNYSGKSKCYSPAFSIEECACVMDLSIARIRACTCDQYLEQFEVNVRTFGDSSSTFKFHEEATSIVLSGPAWAPEIHLPITSKAKVHSPLSQLIIAAALSFYLLDVDSCILTFGANFYRHLICDLICSLTDQFTVTMRGSSTLRCSPEISWKVLP